MVSIFLLFYNTDLNGNISAGADGNANISLSQGRRVVDPITHHYHLVGKTTINKQFRHKIENLLFSSYPYTSALHTQFKFISTRSWMVHVAESQEGLAKLFFSVLRKTSDNAHYMHIMQPFSCQHREQYIYFQEEVWNYRGNLMLEIYISRIYRTTKMVSSIWFFFF
jgi:hypothetical protein